MAPDFVQEVKSAAPAASRTIVVPLGSATGRAPASAPEERTPPKLLPQKTLVARYGTRSFDSLEEMPAELRYYVSTTVEEVASYFEVRPEDLLRLLRARNGNQLRIYRDGTGNESALGVAQLPPYLWNGSAAPDQVGYLAEVEQIEQYGGLGFDWEHRRAWRTWSNGQVAGAPIVGSAASPVDFPDALSALARYLVRSGLTREAAAREPDHFGERLELAVVSLDVQAQREITSAPHDKLSKPLLALRVAFARLMDYNFGASLTAQDLFRLVDQSAVAREVLTGRLGVATAAEKLLASTYQQYLNAARAARAADTPLPWPYIEHEKHLVVQQLAVKHMGHTLTRWEMEQLLKSSNGEIAVVNKRLQERPEARLFARTRQLMDAGLQRSARGLPLYVHEVNTLMQPVLAHLPDQRWFSERAMRLAIGDIKAALRRLPEYRALHGDLFFPNTPLKPMPRVIQAFGKPVSYQSGGVHTGIDLRGRRVDGKQPPLYAVADATVAHVGPLYCLREDACRGPYAIVLDHGNNIYSVYSHNSEATVRPGEKVKAGQMIGRQGNEGYSRGPHLHFEVHIGAPYTGNWATPWRGGRFVDPWAWLPREWLD